jgi:hypothetical protein
MGYLINNGSGFLKDAVQVASVRKAYLFVSGGYQGSTTEIGYDNFGTRVLDDGATIESYACVASEINNSPIANVGRQLFDAYDARVEAASGDTEARDCTITELYDLKQ